MRRKRDASVWLDFDNTCFRTSYMSHKISIVTVSYNSVSAIEKTILSVVGQDYSEKEYIIIDGASKDGTVDVIKKYEEQITFWSSEPDKGIYDAMNKALSHVSGDWVIYMNAGDTFADNTALSRAFAGKDYEGIDIVYGDINQYYEGFGSFVRRYNDIESSEVPYSICHQAAFTRADLLKRFGFDTSFRICADAELFLRMFKAGAKFLYVPELIATFDATDGCSSVNFLKFYNERIQMRGIRKGSFKWLLGYLKMLLNTIILKVMPKNLYTKRQYKRLKRIYR